ncbi:MAG: hypothetical protein JRM80_08915 [Nitrososphaerota archaeon]|nr:hypothetical protein [Nitrososphaerota archaeon]
MKHSKLLAVSVLALLLLSSVPAQLAHAQSPYTEKLNVYVAGSDALWYFTFTGLNGSSHLSALESTPGLSWYNITAVSTAGWQPDFQVFGPRGYDLLPVPYLPSQGLFLTVGASTFADAAAAAAAVDPYLLTNFVSMSNGTGVFSFYSPVSFSTVIPATLLRFLPTAEHGFASAISSSGLVSTPSPFVVLEGSNTGSGFTHSLVVGSIAYSALSSSGAPTVLSYFGGSATSLTASNSSSSSVVKITTLDGVIMSSDLATVTSNSATFSGSYRLTLAPGKSISGVNATVVEQSAPLLATRAVDVGVLRAGTDIAVTLTFTNLSPTDVISNITYADSWWNGTGSFTFLGGNDNVSSISLVAGASTTPVYRLQYTGSATGPLTIPASVVRYQYQTDGKTMNATALLNPITLSQGIDEPVVYATLAPSGSLGKPVGASQTMEVNVFNVGTLPASSVVVAGTPISGLAAKTGSTSGGSATVSVVQSATGLSNVNITRSYAVTYQDPNGTNLQATTNVVSDVFSHVSMVTGFPALAVAAGISQTSATITNVTLAFTTLNQGLANVTSFTAVAALPAGLGCGLTSGTGISCSGGVLTISYPVINQSSALRTFMTYNLTAPANYILPPLTFSGVTPGGNFTGQSNSVSIPAGISLTKAFSPSQLFEGMGSNVTATAVDSGRLPFYNVTLTSTADSFDSLTSTASLTQTAATLAPGENISVTYPVAMSQSYGNLSATPVTATFYFGGTSFSLQGTTSRVQVYQPLVASIVTSPATPIEGKSFTITVEINNPSGVSVSSVLFTLPLPAGVTLSGLQNAQITSRTLTVSDGVLGPGANVTATASAVAGSGITIPFSGAKLTFSYSGTAVNGVVPASSGIAIAENVLTRYLIPTAFILLVMLGVAFYMRRLAASVPASPK